MSMKTEIPKKVVKMLWDVTEVCKTLTTQNLVAAARNNDIKITQEDLQKLVYIVNSTCEQVSLNSSRNFENQLAEMVSKEIDSKSSKTK